MQHKEMSVNAVATAVEKAGGQRVVAGRFNPPVTQQAVARWVTEGKVPPKRAVEFNRITGAALSEICPAVFKGI